MMGLPDVRAFPWKYMCPGRPHVEEQLAALWRHDLPAFWEQYDIDGHRTTPYIMLARKGFYGELRRLVQYEHLPEHIDFNARDSDDGSALWYAFANKDLAAVSLLLYASCDVNVQTDIIEELQGAAPIHLAAASPEKPELLNMLVDAEVDWTLTTAEGHTYAHILVAHDYLHFDNFAGVSCALFSRHALLPNRITGETALAMIVRERKCAWLRKIQASFLVSAERTPFLEALRGLYGTRKEAVPLDADRRIWFYLLHTYRGHHRGARAALVEDV